MNKVQNLIIGAGLSGISCAYYLKDDYLVLEEEETPGGYCRTIPNQEYVWDFAGHFYHFRTEKYKKLFMNLPIVEIYKEALEILKRRSKVVKEEFDKVPYELKFLTYFMNFSKNDYKKLTVFLNKEHGGM